MSRLIERLWREPCRWTTSPSRAVVTRSCPRPPEWLTAVTAAERARHGNPFSVYPPAPESRHPPVETPTGRWCRRRASDSRTRLPSIPPSSPRAEFWLQRLLISVPCSGSFVRLSRSRIGAYAPLPPSRKLIKRGNSTRPHSCLHDHRGASTGRGGGVGVERRGADLAVPLF